MPSGTLPSAGSLGDPQITTGDYQTQIDQLLAYVRSLQSEVALLSSTTIKEGAVRDVGTAPDELVETSQLGTRLGTSGNLGTAAQRDIGTGTTNVVEGARLVKVASATGFGIAAGGSNPISIPAADIQLYAITFGVLCTSDTSISVAYGERNPPSGEAGAYLQGSFGNRRLVITNNTAVTQQFDYAVYRIEVST